jgi:hypothetical protein
MRIGTRAGSDNELVVVSRDPLGKRCVCTCSACGHIMTFSAAAFASGGVACDCAPLSADRRAALRSDQHDLDWRRQQRDWRPQRLANDVTAEALTLLTAQVLDVAPIGTAIHCMAYLDHHSNKGTSPRSRASRSTCPPRRAHIFAKSRDSRDGDRDNGRGRIPFRELPSHRYIPCARCSIVGRLYTTVASARWHRIAGRSPRLLRPYPNHRRTWPVC